MRHTHIHPSLKSMLAPASSKNSMTSRELSEQVVLQMKQAAWQLLIISNMAIIRGIDVTHAQKCDSIFPDIIYRGTARTK